MAKKPTLQTISTDVAGLDSALNSNLSLLRNSFDNTLSLDGSTPNAMNADLDMNSNDILNAGVVYTGDIVVDGLSLMDQVNAAAGSASAAAASAVSASNSADSAAASAAAAANSASVVGNLPDWQGEWLTATAYDLNDLVQQNGNTYIAAEAHTSGVFNDDLGAGKWELFASKGDSGAGTGDLISTNNLSDVASASAARTNLGLAIGTNVQAYDALLQSISGLTFTTNNFIYGTGADAAAVGTITTFGRSLVDDATAADARTTLGLGTIATTDLIDEDSFATNSATRAPSQQSVKAYVDANAGGGFVFIEEQTLSGEATADFTGFDNSLYRSYLFVLSGIRPSGTNPTFALRVSSDGGSSYDSATNNYLSGGVSTEITDSSTTVSSFNSQAGGSTRITISNSVPNSTSLTGIYGEVRLENPQANRNTMVRSSTTWQTGTAIVQQGDYSGLRRATSVVNAVRFLFSSGNIASGTITMYGLRLS